MPLTVTGLPVPTSGSAKVAEASLTVRSSPATRSSDRVTLAAVVPSNALFVALAPTSRSRVVMLA